MNYTFKDKTGAEKTVDIPQAYINQQVKSLGIGMMEACKLYLSDEGYIDNEVVEELTSKASGGKKKRVRKPNYTKQALINLLLETLDNNLVVIGEEEHYIHQVEVMNKERIVRFELDDEIYEVTLSKKRK